jgi:hypothetical protein
MFTPTADGNFEPECSMVRPVTVRWMAYGSALVAALAGSACPAADEPKPSSEWQLLAPEGEGFQIDLPGRAEPQSGEVQTDDGKIYVRMYTLADEGRGRLYSLAASRLPVAPPADRVKPLLDETRDGAVKLVGGKVIEEQDVTQNGYPGRRLLVDANEALFVHARLFVADDRLYQVSIVSRSKSLSADDVRVFDSFKIGAGRLVDPEPKFDWRFFTPEGAKFAVEFPADPRDQAVVLDTPVGRTALSRFECAKGSKTYFLQVCELPTLLATPDDKARLDAVRQHALAASKGTLVDEQELKVAGRAGRLLTIDAGDRTLVTRSFVEGARIYQLGVVGPGETDADDRRFLESLKLPARD